MHGNESRAVAIHSQLIQALAKANVCQEPKSVWDKVVSRWTSIVNVVGANEFGLMHDQRDTGTMYSPNDLNRRFSQEVPIEEVIAGLVSNADVVLDLHNSPNCADCLLFTLDPEVTNLVGHVEYAKATRIPYAVWDHATPTLKAFVNYTGKDGFTMEISGLGMSGYDGDIPEVLKSFLLTPYARADWQSATGQVSASFPVYSHVEGLVSFASQLGDLVLKGSQVCRVTDYAGNPLETFEAPVNGRIIDAPENFVVSEGTEIYRIQPVFFDQ